MVWKMTYPVLFRKKVLNTQEKENLSFAETAKRFGLSKTTLCNWHKSLEPQKKRNKKATKIDMSKLAEDIRLYPDNYCYERAQRLGVSATGVRDAQYRLGVSYKKNSKSSEGGCRQKVYILPGD